MPLWWVSFADPDRPEGTQFLGAAIVEAPHEILVVTAAHAAGCNPGGEALFLELPPAALDKIPPRWRHRLMHKPEIRAFGLEVFGTGDVTNVWGAD